MPVVITHAFVWLCTYIGGKLYKKCGKDKDNEDLFIKRVEDILNGDYVFNKWTEDILNDDYEDGATLNRGPMFIRGNFF